ncbi:shikimate kinase [Microbacterium sp. GXF6406]
MSSPDPLTTVLVGPMGAGKTSVGRQVAKRLGIAFIDTDKRITAEHGPIPEIFTSQGERRFREIEAQIVAAALEEEGVISVGGGAVTSETTRELLHRHPVVFLSVTAEAVSTRIRAGGRPLLEAEDPLARWSEIYQQRLSWYEDVSDITFDTSRRPMQRIADDIAAWRREQA